jgi:5-methyltetrahydropteroyltriglutamate--homocysteine methyltransferase
MPCPCGLIEPFLAGYPEDVGVVVEAINIVTKGVGVTWELHICYSNSYVWPSWEGHDDFLFPTVLDANVHQLVLEFARNGYEDLIHRFGWDGALGLGVVDVTTEHIESAELIAARVHRALPAYSLERSWPRW